MDAAPGYPLFLRLAGRRVLLVGGGAVALEKARALARAGASLRVVAPQIHPELDALADAVLRRAFDDADLDDAWLAIAAATPEVNRAVRLGAARRRVFVVAVDDVDNCTAIGAATLERGGLTLAISSDGRAPALVALLRRALERLLPDEVALWVAIAEGSRRTWKAAGIPFTERRPLLLRALNAFYDEAPAVSP